MVTRKSGRLAWGFVALLLALPARAMEVEEEKETAASGSGVHLNEEARQGNRKRKYDSSTSDAEVPRRKRRRIEENQQAPAAQNAPKSTLTDGEIRQFLCEFTEQKSRELGWTEAWEWWREVFHTPGLRQIIRDYVFDKDEEDTSLQWTDEGRYCHVIKQMSPPWRARLAQPQVLRHVTGDGLAERLLTDEPAALLLLAERARQEPEFKQELFDWIEQSKSTDGKQAAVAAANALTILNAAGVSFSGMDLRGINAPGAVLDGAVMDGTDLRGANLAGAWLGHASLSQARLGQAVLLGTRFGEQAFFKGHTDSVNSVGFSGDGTRVASGSSDNTVRVWDMQSGAQLQVFKGHTDTVWGVSFS
ncbi:MAG: pentapeptide repeat-containing protein, partial [Myxococcota bacterium]